MDERRKVEKIIGLIARSVALKQEDSPREALECIEEALLLDPGFFPALIERAMLLCELDRHEEALLAFDRLTKRLPNAEGIAPLRNEAVRAALNHCDTLLQKNPGDAKALVLRGDVLRRLYRFEEALGDYLGALRTAPANVETLNRIGKVSLDLNDHENALDAFGEALGIAPGNAALLFNRGNVFQRLGRMREAMDDYTQALGAMPDFPEALVELAHCRLATGDYKTGWLLYESRWETEQMKRQRLETGTPVWRGRESLAGKTVLLWAEQGFGDTIQFLRYVPLVAAKAQRVILRMTPPLMTLSASLKGSIEIVPLNGALPPHDFHCPLLSLPLAFGTTLDTIPSGAAYLRPPRGRVHAWRTRLGPRSRFRVGIAWAGRRREPLNLTRDMTLETLRPLTDLDIDLISLQKLVPEGDRSVLESMRRVHGPAGDLRDFAETAALIENLDLVLSVDTGVAHLAGALGKPVWVMLRQSGEWRWLLGRGDSPWYPTMRLFRQEIRGDWTGVVRDVVEELHSLIGSELRPAVSSRPLTEAAG
ncbi:MAG: tetratricopeptide repeat-containing glycosyltransferase family protein [Desulfobacteraceae bacterium]|nr:tetratricopeptide repeat-containing glycosyltransferase family protein [Desulfobacteraceae bacterium]